ncbi:MAG TPA: hypothetical protein PLI60_02945, partial [Anaerolineaceae bacterium]|nr:hypothetical protein [Anaerolineaceae bacterium]HQP08140.1 hypothetical protein [Anaerolineaceae bacterium]
MLPPYNYKSTLVIILLLGLLLSSCAQPSASPSPIESPVVETTASPAEDTPAPPQQSSLAVVGLETWDPGQQQEIRAALMDIAGEVGLTLVEQGAETAGTVPENAAVVIHITEAGSTAELAAANPEIRFVAVTRIQQSSSANLAVVYLPLAARAFLAGYTSTVIAPDFRSAGLFLADEPYGPPQVYAFQNGGGYFCGTCYPYYSPLVQFPLVGYLSAGADTTAWQGLANELLLNVVYVIYLDEYASDPVLQADLAGKGIILVGSDSPPDTVRNMYAATIGFDLPAALLSLQEYILG